MNGKTSLLVKLLGLICITNAATPKFITKCKSSDSKCAKASAQVAIPLFAAGLSDLGVEQLDPVTFARVDASSANLKFILTDVTVTGLKNCKAKKIQRDVEKSKMYLKFACTANLDGNYELKGQLLFVPIEGTGKMHVTLRATEINVELDMTEKSGDDGKNHWHIKSWQHSFELKEKSDVIFDNLFEGNEVLAQAAKELIGNNGNDVINEIGGPMIKTAVAKIVHSVENFFKHVPAEDLSLE